jgi:glycine/D-amino acid oxidase-like deaminating enzyme
MSDQAHDVVICGAGIAGISAAYFLTRAGIKDVLLVDERPPLDLTSSRSTECYRNWWGDPGMLALMNRSIDLLEALAQESGNVFGLNRRGYLFITANESSVSALQARAERISSLGAGPVRIHTADDSAYQPPSPEGYADSPGGADILLGTSLILKHFPYLSERSVAALHVRRAGWMSAQQLGMYLLDEARKCGVKFELARVTGVDISKGKVQSVRLSNGKDIPTRHFVNAGGPYVKDVGCMLGLDLPIYTELHLKVAFKDHLGVLGRDAPLLIWNDPQTLVWTGDERALLNEDPETRWLTEALPAGVHTRPEGGAGSQTALMLWDYQTKVVDPVWPPVLDEQYPEVALRGLAVMIPGFKQYFGRAPRPQLDGGYYTRTRENRLLAGPTPVKGAFVIGALSGYGIMSACGAGELLAAHVTGSSLPPYAGAFSLARYDDPEYVKNLEHWEDSDQL